MKNLLLVDVLKDILEASIVLLQDSVLCAEVQGHVLGNSHLEARVSESDNGLLKKINILAFTHERKMGDFAGLANQNVAICDLILISTLSLHTKYTIVLYLVSVVHAHTDTGTIEIVDNPLLGLTAVLGRKGHLETARSLSNKVGGLVLFKMIPQ